MLRRNFKILACCGIVLLTAFLLGCEEDDANKLATAQACLDEVTDANYADAADCMTPIESLDSQQANILKCGISFVSGGLTTEKIKDAYKSLDDNNDNKESLFIGILTLDTTAKADAAANYCERSEVGGLIYLASLSKVGTYMMVNMGFTTGGVPSAAQVEAAIDNCQANPANCDDAVVGEAIVNVSDVYCNQSANKDSDVCKKINEAVADANGDYAAVAAALYDLLEQ